MAKKQELLDRLRTGLDPRYELDCEVGRGAMAAVFLASDNRYQRTVAIKVLLPEVATMVGASRFIREIRITARLSHPHILPLFDSGEASGMPFYVTPFIAGDDLKVTLRCRGKLSPVEADQLVGQISLGLEYAHAQGIFHRDIKPGNILLEEGIAVVADFGIARALNLSGDNRLTESGVGLGTPTYMSPEQALDSSEANAASDQYSLACVLFEMLMGKPPFSGRTVLAILVKHATQPAPSVLGATTDIPRELNDVLQRALKKRPEDRYISVGEFAKAVSNAVRGTSSEPATT